MLCKQNAGRHSPFECTKDSGCFGRAAHSPEAAPIVDKDRSRDETSKPEDHRNGFKPQDREVVMRIGFLESPWNYDQEDERKKCPDCAEDEEVDRVRT